MKSKQIDDFPNYIITDNGDVFNKNGHKLKPSISNNGYLRVSLSNSEVSHKRFLVHRLVASAFIPNPDGTTIEGKVSSWNDYDQSDMIQVKIDGITYLTHSSNVILEMR